MTFPELLSHAKAGEHNAINELLSMYRPLIIKESIVDGVFNEDLYQELCITLLNCIKAFVI